MAHPPLNQICVVRNGRKYAVQVCFDPGDTFLLLRFWPGGTGAEALEFTIDFANVKNFSEVLKYAEDELFTTPTVNTKVMASCVSFSCTLCGALDDDGYAQHRANPNRHGLSNYSLHAHINGKEVS